MERLGIQCEMLSQGASKVNISIVVHMSQKDALIKCHTVFFEGMSLDAFKSVDYQLIQRAHLAQYVTGSEVLKLLSLTKV